MIRWWPAIVLSSGCLLAALVWLVRRANAPDTTIDMLIKAPDQRFVGQDDTLRVASEARRAIATDRRRQALQIESGKPVESRIRMVQR